MISVLGVIDYLESARLEPGLIVETGSDGILQLLRLQPAHAGFLELLVLLAICG
jgi:hypothetical protein